MKDKINQRAMEKIASAIRNADKDRLTLIQRNRYGRQIYHIRDASVPGKPKLHSLRTEDKGIAHTLFTDLTTKVEWEASELGAKVAIGIAKLDQETRNRTWSDAFEACKFDGLSEGTLSTQDSAWNQPAFDAIRNTPIISTTRNVMMELFTKANPSHQKLCRQVVLRASAEGWLLNPKILTLSDRQTHLKVTGGTTGSMTDEVHYAILNAIEVALSDWRPHHPEVRHRIASNSYEQKPVHEQFYTFLKVIWLMGASNEDTRTLRVDNVNWESGHISFKRGKWSKRNGGTKKRPPIQWPMCQELKKLVRPLYNKAKNDKDSNGFLFPLLAHKKSAKIMEYFKNYARVAGVELKVNEDGETKKLIIHSYRYRMAGFLFKSGYTEREAQDMMGHNSREVHYAYAKGAKLKIKPIDQQRKDVGLDKIVAVDKAA